MRLESILTDEYRVGLYPISKPPPPANMRVGTHADHSATGFSNTLTAAPHTTANKNKKEKPWENEKTYEYEPRHPFQPRLGLGHLVSTPGAIRRDCEGKNMMEAKMKRWNAARKY